VIEEPEGFVKKSNKTKKEKKEKEVTTVQLAGDGDKKIAGLKEVTYQI